jgi:Tfp pilus assembly protein PilO
MLTKKKLLALIGTDASVALGAMLCATVAVWLVGGAITFTADTVVEQKKLSATLEMRSGIIAQLMQDAARSRGAQERVDAALLPANNVLEFVGAVESMALKDNVTASLRFDTPSELGETVGTPPRHIVQVPFTISVQANIFTFLQYVKDVESLPYFTRIESISITGAEGGWQNTSNISIRGTLYTRGDK